MLILQQIFYNKHSEKSIADKKYLFTFLEKLW